MRNTVDPHVSSIWFLWIPAFAGMTKLIIMDDFLWEFFYPFLIILMVYWYIWAIPLAVFAAVSLFR